MVVMKMQKVLGTASNYKSSWTSGTLKRWVKTHSLNSHKVAASNYDITDRTFKDRAAWDVVRVEKRVQAYWGDSNAEGRKRPGFAAAHSFVILFPLQKRTGTHTYMLTHSKVPSNAHFTWVPLKKPHSESEVFQV